MIYLDKPTSKLLACDVRSIDCLKHFRDHLVNSLNDMNAVTHQRYVTEFHIGNDQDLNRLQTTINPFHPICGEMVNYYDGPHNLHSPTVHNPMFCQIINYLPLLLLISLTAE